MTMNSTQVGMAYSGVPVRTSAILATKTSDQTINSLTPVAITSLTVTIAARVGDWCLVGGSYGAGSEAFDISAQIYTVVASTRTNSICPGGTTFGNIGLALTASLGASFGPCMLYQVTAADLDTAVPTNANTTGKSVTFAVYAFQGAAGNKTFQASSTQNSRLWAINLGTVKQSSGDVVL